MKMFFPPVAPPDKELIEDERDDECAFLTSSVLELRFIGLIDATEHER